MKRQVATDEGIVDDVIYTICGSKPSGATQSSIEWSGMRIKPMFSSARIQLPIPLNNVHTFIAPLGDCLSPSPLASTVRINSRAFATTAPRFRFQLADGLPRAFTPARKFPPFV